MQPEKDLRAWRLRRLLCYVSSSPRYALFADPLHEVLREEIRHGPVGGDGDLVLLRRAFGELLSRGSAVLDPEQSAKLLPWVAELTETARSLGEPYTLLVSDLQRTRTLVATWLLVTRLHLPEETDT